MKSLPWLAVLLLGCGGDSQSSEPVGYVPLTGYWMYSDSIRNSMTGDYCLIRDRPVQFYVERDSMWGAVEQRGGSITCVVGGVRQPTTNLDNVQRWVWLVTENADGAVRFDNYNLEGPYLTWNQVTPDQMQGHTGERYFYNQSGTWRMVR